MLSGLVIYTVAIWVLNVLYFVFLLSWTELPVFKHVCGWGGCREWTDPKAQSLGILVVTQGVYHGLVWECLKTNPQRNKNLREDSLRFGIAYFHELMMYQRIHFPTSWVVRIFLFFGEKGEILCNSYCLTKNSLSYEEEQVRCPHIV